MVSKGYPLIMAREVYYAIAGLVATEQMSMGKIINMLLREALENRGLLAKQQGAKDQRNAILERQLTNAFKQWNSLKPKAKNWYYIKAKENQQLPIAKEILKRQAVEETA